MSKTKIYIDKNLPFLELRYSFSDLSYKEHFHHDIFSIGAVIRGKREYKNRDNLYEISKNDLAIVNPNVIHSCNCLQSHKSEYYMLYINKHWICDILNFKEYLDFKDELIHDDKLFNEFINVCETIFSNRLYLEKELKLIDFISKIYENYSEVKSSKIKNNTKIDSLVKFLEENVKENITLEQLSKNFNLSKFYIIKLFKKEFGISVYSFFLNLKIELAKKLLKKDLTIVEVALECGFYDQSHFHRNFLKITASTPKEYKDNFVQ
ncbi:AraC family transcriptional regulator [Malaciobacter molluscorum LMG 25693]|uniref:AraC family transcriptional regulator n=1 Tax=Malaciobacter molluscorum LMG 25693 TaxID=870501 RepID=A0A2G1DHC4_9BACT|nr:AraC family transcriptional regulator [Malaciobacter molluscorum]AXX91048.1 transcriptional regulator, AraC family [Malaciobacter molluscorum LMG 25693]PHO17877.1 AraC family transcriptional regulator [Malaciobacter molluscorum LMG 25693]RXJ93610.1 AraC family transcriptional regulator [Malaciobacter molluscorum]